MPQVPIYNEPTVADKHIGHNYEHVDINGDMLGQSIVRANYVLAKATNNLTDSINKQLDQYQKTKITELSNQLDAYNQSTLYDKDNGYFFKTGKNAAGQSGVVMQNYDQYAQELLANANLTGQYKTMAEATVLAKRNQIFTPVNRHDFEQTQAWENAVYTDKQNNILTQGILDRNDANLLEQNLRQGYNAVELQGQIQNWDSDTVALKKAEFASKFHEGVISALISDGSLQAQEYYNAHKDEILPARHNSILNAVKNNELKYNSKRLAGEIIVNSADEAEAYRKAEAIDNIELSEATLNQVKRYYSQQEHLNEVAQRDRRKQFYDNAVSTIEQGGTLSYDLIPADATGEEKLSYMNFINKNGQPETDDQVWTTLYEMSVNNAQGFVNEDLNKYRGFLSESEYKQFVKRQEDIKKGDFYSFIKDDDKMIKEALKEIGLKSDGKQASAFSEIRAMTRELEARKGRKITDAELQNITKSLGYKEGGDVLYKQLEKGMKERTGFMRDVINDFAYYQSKHNGEMPPDAEKLKIINNRIAKKAQEQNQRLINSLEYKIQHTQAKPNETKELTYYADKYLPELGNEMGVKFTIVDGGRYRPANGKYISHHTEGKAVDVSMSEHNESTKLSFIERQLANPQVKKIGTSDTNILAKYGTHPKIEDERNFDKQHGTNHVNHAHITLNVGTSSQLVRMKAPDGRIVNVPQSMVSVALKNGGVRL